MALDPALGAEGVESEQGVGVVGPCGGRVVHGLFRSVLPAVLWVLGVGASVLVPSLWLLYATFQRGTADEHSPH
ncbi:hypothetical protein [Streptomyces sp. NPDC058291]|jgi:hypothetical protein|uniref:hypothetical protein n=1 Tax=Streptomyces sp. NPDC058291 TaxID=3346427 RepID=UPI0036E3D7AE